MTGALRLANLSKSFGGIKAIDQVTLDVPEGTLSAIIGPNGAGKTTLFNLITNLYTPDTGEVLFHGTRINDLAADKIAAMGLIRTFQTARIFPGMTAHENALAGAHLHIQSGPFMQMLWSAGSRREERALSDKVDALLELVNLTPFRDVAATELPMGAQKLLEVIRALMAKPKLLLLDEPAAGLNDTETAELSDLLRAVRGSGVTVLVVEHNMSLVMSVADQVIVLDAGAVVASGTPDQIQQNKRVIAAYIGAEDASSA